MAMLTNSTDALKSTALRQCKNKKTSAFVVRLLFCKMFATHMPSQSASPNPTEHDMIGPPDPISNLRPVVYHIPRNEQEIEKAFRIRREEVQKWNDAFWRKHNQSFLMERKEFVAANLPQNKYSETDKQMLSADEMSVFYKTFLDKNWKVHMQYNAEWYRKNIGLVIFALRVKIFKVKQWFMANTK